MAGQGTVTVRVIGNVSGLKTAMSEAETTTKGAMDRVGASAEGAGGHFDNLKSHVGGVVTAAVGLGVFAVGAEAIKGATNQAVENQKAMGQLMQAMQQGGEQTGPQFADGLQKVIDKGTSFGYGMNDTVHALTHLREAGVSTSQAMDAMPAIWDLARAKNIDLDQSAKAVVMGMQGQGRALKDLNVALPPAISGTKSIQNALDKYNAALAAHGPNSKQAIDALKKYQDAQAHAAGGTEYLDQITQSLEDRLGGQAQATANSAAGAWEVFTAQIKEAGANIMGAAMPAITQLMQSLGPIVVMLLQTLAPAFIGVVTAVTPLIQSVVNALIPAFKAIMPAVQQVLAALVPVIQTLVNSLAPAFTMVVKAVAPVIAQLMTQLAPVFTQVINALAPLIVDLLKDFLPIWKDLAPLLVPIVQLLGSVLVPILQLLDKVVQALQPVFQAFGNIAKTVFGDVIGAAQHVWDFFKDAVGFVGDVFHKIGDAISAPFRAAFDLVADLWNNTLGRLNFTIPGWVPGIGGDHFGLPQIPKMHTGGEVPGNPGDEMLAILQAGERVVPAGGPSGNGINVTVFAMSQSDPLTIGNAVARGIRTKSRVVYA